MNVFVCVCVCDTHTQKWTKRGREREMRGGLTQIRKSNNSQSSEKHASQGSEKTGMVRTLVKNTLSSDIWYFWYFKNLHMEEVLNLSLQPRSQTSVGYMGMCWAGRVTLWSECSVSLDHAGVFYQGRAPASPSSGSSFWFFDFTKLYLLIGRA